MIERLGLATATFDIIYNLREWLEARVLDARLRFDRRGRGLAKILKFFSRTKDRQIVGGR